MLRLWEEERKIMKRKQYLNTLEELKRDLVDPIRSFTEEVCSDTFGDAKRFYAAMAKKAQENAKLAVKRMREKAEAVRREKEEMKKHRKEMIKRAAIILAVLSVLIMIIFSLALKHGL